MNDFQEFKSSISIKTDECDNFAIHGAEGSFNFLTGKATFASDLLGQAHVPWSALHPK